MTLHNRHQFSVCLIKLDFFVYTLPEYTTLQQQVFLLEILHIIITSKLQQLQFYTSADEFA